MKKIIAIFLTLFLVFALAAGCSKGDDTLVVTPPLIPPTADENGDNDPSLPSDGEVTTVSIWFMGGGADNEDSLVVEAANNRLRELGLNINIKPVWTGGWGMGEPAQVAIDTGDTSIDIFWTATWGLNYFTNSRTGNFVRLDDPDNDLLRRYGQDMLAEVDDSLWGAFRADGPAGFGLYGVPGPKDSTALFTLDVNNTRLADLAYDFDELFDMNGVNIDILFDPVFNFVN